MKPVKILILFFLLSVPLMLHGQNIEISKDGNSKYAISFVPATDTICKQAAMILQEYLQKIGNVRLPIQNNANSPYIILIGKGKFVQHLIPNVPTKNLDSDGFTIKTIGTQIIIAGGSHKGPLYGVYTFLEKYLGCRMYSSKVMSIPHQSSITIPSIHLTEIPKLIFRDVFYRPAFSQQYADWHKLTPARTSYLSSWGTWVHSSFQFVPPSKYFEDHPEYYSLVNNKRIPDQLNYTNPEVYHIFLGNLNAKIKSQPQYQYWSVSQEDNNHYCQCDQCEKIYQKTGSPSGTIVEFVNKLAKFFPNKTISTLAYSYSRKPPENIKLVPNLNIMFCTNIKNYVTNYATSFGQQSMRNDLNGWLKLTSNIFIYDYLINFKALESIYPNLLKLKPNLDYFVKKGIKGYFAQGNYYPGGEFAELRCYLMAKLLWNPDADDKAIIQDFLQGFYGKGAAPFLWKYIQLIDQQLTGGPDKLTPNEANTYYKLFQQAEAAVSDQKTFLQRVQKERMGLDYSVIQMYLRLAKADPKEFFKDNKQYNAFNDATERFLKDLVQNKTQRLIHAKHNIPLYQFIVKWRKQMNDLRKDF